MWSNSEQRNVSTPNSQLPIPRAPSWELGVGYWELSRRVCRTLVLIVVSLAIAGTAHAQSTLADRIQAGDRKAALEMIAAGANVNQAQPDGSTPLQWAIYRVDRELVDRLLKKGAKANVVNR